MIKIINRLSVRDFIEAPEHIKEKFSSRAERIEGDGDFDYIVFGDAKREKEIKKIASLIGKITSNECFNETWYCYIKVFS